MGWGAKHKRSTTQLPAELSGELGLDEPSFDADDADGGARSRTAAPSRKQRRKEERLAKKQRQRHGGVPEVAMAAAPPLPPKKRKRKRSERRSTSEAGGGAGRAVVRAPTAFEEMLVERGLVKGKGGREAADAMDDQIEELERKLGLRKGNKARAEVRLQRELEADGLGALARVGVARTAAKGEAKVDESSEDEALLDEEYGDGMGESMDDDELGDEEEGEEEDDEETDVEPAQPPPRKRAVRDLYGQGASSGGEAGGAHEPTTPRAVVAATAEGGGGKYVPPALRAAKAGEAAALSEAVRRRLRGLLNRLSEHNLVAVSGEMAELFAASSSRELGAELTKAVLASSLSDTQILAPLVLLNAALLRALSIRLGPQLLYFFVEAVVLAFEKELRKARTAGSQQHHACGNAALFLAQLYNLRSVHCALIFDLVRMLVDGFGEAELEILTTLLRTVGGQLRADDATALKEIVLQVQAKSATSEGGQSARARVFVSMLVELKNNKHKARDEADGPLARMQKTLRQMAATSGGTEPPPFNVRWAELVEADVTGRWWIVGSAWAGRSTGKSDGAKRSSAERDNEGAASKEETLLELARAQRMNTDVRRSIFVAIMGSEDYVDAHDRISKLRLKKGQQPEIVRVLFECCGQEGIFNRFYALLAARLCTSHREVKFTMQFAFWDEFKSLAEISLHRAANVAKLLAHMLSRDALSISLLKVVKWHRMSERMLFFWQVFFVELLSEPAANVLKVVVPCTLPENAELRDGIQLFSARHLKPLIESKHASLVSALRMVDKVLDGDRS
ncbi:hypothetical protein AB1Y20_005648 [Prymnesium parvum]|uniref:MI domain-containing protein n=1 Tax=Prymnesium parvum TaxID=97485 RepID=A0AB34J787_PRYPA